MAEILDVPKLSTPVESGAAYSHSYLDWTAVIAGALVGIAIIATMTAFGSAIGLTLTSPSLGRGMNAYGMAMAIAIWTMWVVISGHIAAGYVAGRMRHAVPDSTVEESEIRNGAHGLVAWAITTLVVTLLVGFAVLGGERTVTNGTQDHPAQIADQLLRNDARPGVDYNEGVHREVAAILRTVSTRKVSSTDKSFLVALVGRNDQNGAEQRVDAAITDVKDYADAARKIGVLVGFLTAASLAVGAAASWWAAKVGGAHRLDYRGISVFTRWK
jgi:hypothetical protein